jgi:Mg-chelatase subunit ChlD
MTTTQTPSTSTDLIATQRAIDKLNRSLAKSDLDALVMGARRSLLLVDCSGSMGEYIRAGGRKIDALRKVVTALRETHATPLAAFGLYGDPVQVVDTVPEPMGGTPIDLAIDFGRREGATHLVVVTDGCPNSEDSAFAAARAFGHPIDVFYIGDGNDSGSRFAAALAKMTGGTCELTDLGKPRELAGKITLLLGDGN